MIRDEILHLRSMQARSESQYRILAVSGIFISILSGVLVNQPSSVLALALPLVCWFVLVVWANSEKRYRDAEDRAVGLLLNMREGASEEGQRETSNEYRLMDEDVAMHLDKWIRTRPRITSVERIGYGITIAAVFGIMLFNLITGTPLEM
jgi:hypothetical protein